MSVTAVPIQPIPRHVVALIWVGVVLAVLVGVLVAVIGTHDKNASFLSSNARADGVVTTPSGLEYKVLTLGTGKTHPTPSDFALVTYEGTLLDGKTFDKSQNPTPLPVSGVVPGFSEGLKLMTKGAKYRFWIKPSLGYGEKDQKDPQGNVAIPGNSLLVFDVTLLDFLPESYIRQMQQMQGAGGVPGGAVPPAGH